MMTITELQVTEDTYHLEVETERLSLPRVTSILSVVRDLSRIPAEVLAHAAARGKAVHKGCWLLCGGAGSPIHWPSVHPDVIPYLEAFQAFLRATRVRVVTKEQLVVSRRFGFAGRADLILEGLSRYLDVVDIKSGIEDPSHALQTAAYETGYQETTGTKRKLGRFALYLRANGTYRLQPMTAASDFAVFMACKSVYQWQQAQNGRNAA